MSSCQDSRFGPLRHTLACATTASAALHLAERHDHCLHSGSRTVFLHRRRGKRRSMYVYMKEEGRMPTPVLGDKKETRLVCVVPVCLDAPSFDVALQDTHVICSYSAPSMMYACAARSRSMTGPDDSAALAGGVWRCVWTEDLGCLLTYGQSRRTAERRIAADEQTRLCLVPQRFRGLYAGKN